MSDREKFYISKVSFPGIDISSPRGPCDNFTPVVDDIARDKDYFRPVGDEFGPYDLKMSVVENKLAFQIKNSKDEDLQTIYISFSPYKSFIGDYYILCDSYVKANEVGGPSRLEAIDMGRRALHNEGAALLMERMAHRIDMEMSMARRIFTLLCVLHGRSTIL